jgi:ABC-type uncharacterized transport system substrate-binding protein
MAATNEIPIVFRHPGDPQTMGLVKSNTRPGGNVTGVAGFGIEITGKRLEALKQIIPEVRRLHIFYDLNDKSSRDNFAFAKKSAEMLGLEVVEHGTKSAEELKTSLGNLQIVAATLSFKSRIIWSIAKRIHFQTARRRSSPPCLTKSHGPSKGRLVRMALAPTRWVGRPPAL